MADRIISLGIGDTTQPIPPHILGGLVEGASKLGNKEGYSGYGAEQGMAALREKIASSLYNGIIDAEEVFVSDGAKCDIMRYIYNVNEYMNASEMVIILTHSIIQQTSTNVWTKGS